MRVGIRQAGDQHQQGSDAEHPPAECQPSPTSCSGDADLASNNPQRPPPLPVGTVSADMSHSKGEPKDQPPIGSGNKSKVASPTLFTCLLCQLTLSANIKDSHMGMCMGTALTQSKTLCCAQSVLMSSFVLGMCNEAQCVMMALHFFAQPGSVHA